MYLNDCFYLQKYNSRVACKNSYLIVERTKKSPRYVEIATIHKSSFYLT